MKNKVVIVTGASSGIGKACATFFAAKGSKVVFSARSVDKLRTISNSLNEKGYDTTYVQADVSKEIDCQRLINEALVKYKKIDILINNAGISMRALLDDLELTVFEKVMRVNFFGTVYCTKFALPHILETKGSIVGISSIAGYKGLPARTAYSASKFAMHGFLESLRIENLEKKLHVLIACPGFTASNIRKTALSKDGTIQAESPRNESQMMSAEEVAENVYKSVLHRQNSLVLTINGKLTVFLNKFFPNLVNRLIFNHLKKEPNSPF